MNNTETRPTLAYLRCSTDEQGDSRLGLEAQETAIHRALEQRGWKLTAEPYIDIASGKSMRHRPALAAAMAHAKRVGGVLVASQLDRVSRNVIDYAAMLSQADRERWALLALDLPMDTSTPEGRFAAISMANVAEFERGRTSQRTKRALAALKARGKRLGPTTRHTPPEILDRVTHERDSGSTWQSIADRLNADRVPTVRSGALWRVSTVQRAYQSARLDRQAEEARRVAGRTQ